MELGTYKIGGEDKPYITNRRNFLFVGKRETGKSQTLIRLALNDIYENRNVIFIGNESTNEILKLIPNERQAETIYFNPSIQNFAFNPLANVPPEKHKALANSIIDTIHTLLSYDGSTPVLDDYIRAGILTLLCIPGASLVDLYFLLTDQKFRSNIPHNVSDKFLNRFWERFETLTPKEQRSDISSTLNKLSVFVFDPVLRNCLDQPNNYISFDNSITLVSLDDLDLGEDSASFLGALILASLNSQANDGLDTTIYIDDPAQFGSRILGKILKLPGVNIVLAVRSLDEFHNPNDVLKSSEVIALRTSLGDAKVLEPDFTLDNSHEPLNQIPYFTAYVMDNGKALELDLPIHSFVQPIKPKNEKKSVDKRIIDRCAHDCTLRPEKIEERLGRFF